MKFLLSFTFEIVLKLLKPAKVDRTRSSLRIFCRSKFANLHFSRLWRRLETHYWAHLNAGIVVIITADQVSSLGTAGPIRDESGVLWTNEKRGILCQRGINVSQSRLENIWLHLNTHHTTRSKFIIRFFVTHFLMRPIPRKKMSKNQFLLRHPMNAADGDLDSIHILAKIPLSLPVWSSQTAIWVQCSIFRRGGADTRAKTPDTPPHSAPNSDSQSEASTGPYWPIRGQNTATRRPLE